MNKIKNARPSDVLYFVILIGVGTLSIVLPTERALVQGIAIGATGVLLIVGFLEYRARRRREGVEPVTEERRESDRRDTPRGY
ncbi:hypothetical protein ACR8AL_01085 [Clavibacter sepedonicus]|uniref:hypothetical protein n=1 Tax=Clavibacter TaxID=1573 RepID=UPI00059E7720|nr:MULTISPECIES: hypothetical protein [Clavibacter]MBD5382990.1 hypothetical protein [Clavibacter sp.]OQJ49285.1 hypothetical protein B5P19_14350 [Clavibacter sepedonicus]OQJ54900.1 hypothetical protein B5P20_12930 [Clavibacter sepedonicus]UUK64870.1 hypothetical protein LRE50_11300 [Clavibacter sepedonicus]